MSRIYPIKWRESDKATINRTVRNFNAKIDRVARNNPDAIEALPSKVTVKELKSKITTRADFNREINSLKRFSRRGSEKIVENKYGVAITAWEKREQSIKARAITTKRRAEKRRIEQTPVTDRGRDTGFVRGEMGNARTAELRPKKFNFDSFRTKTEFDKWKATADKQIKSTSNLEKMESYKQNYLQAILNQLSGAGELAKELYNLVSKIPANIFTEVYYSEESADIDYVYLPIDAITSCEFLLELWGNVGY